MQPDEQELLPDETPAGEFEFEVGVRRALIGYDAFMRRMEVLRENPLSAFLEHAVTTTAYYRERASGQSEIGDFEPVDRETMRGRRGEFLSETYCDDSKELLTWTNGTLSKALAVAFDPAGFYDVNQFSLARIIDTRPQLWKVIQPGRLALCLIDDVPQRPRITVFMSSLRGSLMRRICLGRSASEDREVVKYLSALQGIILYGKPHTLSDLAIFTSRTQPDSIRPSMILTSGENLYESDRNYLRKSFGCEVINAYTATEAGLIGIDCCFGNGFHVLTDRIHLEVLDDGQIRPEGSGELLVTNMMNWGQVFVRYRLGDTVQLECIDCRCGFTGPTLTRLSGRDELYFDVPNAGVIATEQLGRFLDCPQVQQFEVKQQDDRDLLIRWRPAGNADKLPSERISKLRHMLGGHFRLEKTDRIVAPGGKLRRFVKE